MSQFTGGFSPENVRRIYLGVPALVEGFPPEYELTERQRQVAALMVDDFTYEGIAREIGVSKAETDRDISEMYQRLDLFDIPMRAKALLPGFFPLSPEDPILENKLLSELTRRQLQVLELLSRGRSYPRTAKTLGIKEVTVSVYANQARKTWGELRSVTSTVRVANGIRANYTQGLKRRGIDPARHLGAFALPVLVEHEPTIREKLGLQG